MRSMITMMAIIAINFTLSSCNTIEGVGKDVKKGGEKLENAAERAK